MIAVTENSVLTEQRNCSVSSQPFFSARRGTRVVRHLLENRANRCRIGRTETHRQGGGVDGGAGRQKRCWTFQLAGKVSDGRHVLLPYLHFHRCRRVVTSHHHRPPHLKHPRIASTIGDYFQHHRRIET